MLVVEAPIEHRRFLFGTDANGRDLLTRTLVAGRISLAIGLLATLRRARHRRRLRRASPAISADASTSLMMRVVDILYALPFIFFVILLVVFFGRNFILMFLAVGAIEWLDMARIVRGQTLSLQPAGVRPGGRGARRRHAGASSRATSCRTCSAPWSST